MTDTESIEKCYELSGSLSVGINKYGLMGFYINGEDRPPSFITQREVNALRDALNAHHKAESSSDVGDLAKELLEKQQDLDLEAAKILYDNLWDLYLKDEDAPAASSEGAGMERATAVIDGQVVGFTGDAARVINDLQQQLKRKDNEKSNS